MTQQKHFLAFEINASVYNQSIDFIETTLNGSDGDVKSLNKLAAKTIITLLNTGLEAYYDKPSDLVKISPVLRKAADTGVNAIKKGLNLVISRIFIKTPVAQLKIMANYMAELISTNSGADTRYYVALPLEKDVFALSQKALHQVQTNENIDEYRNDIIASLIAIIAAGTDAYYTKPASLVSLGRLTRKAADLGINAAEKTSHAVVKKLFKSMGHPPLIPLSVYFQTLLHDDMVNYSVLQNRKLAS